MCVFELIGHAFVGDMPMLVVIRQTCSCIFEFLGWLYRMGIVITKNSFAIGLMQCQRIANPVRNVRRRINNLCLDLDPIPTPLIDDLIMEVDKSGYSVVFTHAEVYQQLINHSTAKPPTP